MEISQPHEDDDKSDNHQKQEKDESGIQMKENPQREDLQLVLEIVDDLKEDGIIGDQWTQLALKNKSSFVIGTSRRGLILVENGKEIYSGKLPGNSAYLGDIVYLPCLNSYILDYAKKLYRKDINNKPPYLYLCLKGSNSPGTSLAYSPMNQRLILNKDRESFVVINPKTNKLGIELKKQVGNQIVGFRMFGHREDRIICLTYDCFVIISSLLRDKTRGVKTHFKIRIPEGKSEMAESLGICDRHEFVLVEIRNRENSTCSRMLILRYEGEKFTITTSLDFSNQMLGYKLALGCFGYLGTRIIWVGLARGGVARGGMAHLYDFDTKTGELRELTDKRLNHIEQLVFKLHPLNGHFYYTGNCGQFMKLSLIVN